MQLYVLPILFALFVWWFSTGLIIYLDGLPRHTFRWSFAGTTVLLLISLYGLLLTRDDTSIAGAYWAFTWGTLAWGWQEVSFYMGFVTGPRKTPCPETCKGLPHFGHAIQTSLYHELAVIVSAAVVVALTWGGANQIGTWTFLIMWWMHQSAKLNVYFGVRNLNLEFLPEHLKFLSSFLTKKPMNAFFPLSVSVSTVIATLLLIGAFAPESTPFETIGFTFLGFLMVLAILEHWLLVLPLPGTLWDWGLRSRAKVKPAEIEVVAGFLGAGKTTFLRRLLAEADPDVRTVVLVNDFGALGIDSSLVSGRGADVVELPNGCICCSLRTDLARQIRETVTRFAPQRLLIEPSGVAEVASLVRTLSRADLVEVVGSVRVYTLVDAGAFLRDYAQLPEYFEAQAHLAPVLIVNKADLATPGELRTIEETLHTLNPRATILTATYGALTTGTLEGAIVARETHAEEEHTHEDQTELGLKPWSTSLAGVYDEQQLRGVLDAAVAGGFGEILRAKGIARVRRGWVNFDVAGGRTGMVAFAPRSADEQPRVMVIGRSIDATQLAAAFASCRVDLAEDRPLVPLAV